MKLSGCVPDIEDPEANDGESDGSDDEMIEKRDFKQLLKQHGRNDLNAINNRSDDSESDDPDWLVEKIYDESVKKDRKRRKAFELAEECCGE